MKKLVFAFSLAILSISTAHAISVCQIFDKIGYGADFVLSKGHVSSEDEKLFKEVAASLGIENRDIKVRNSGLLLRILAGYNNALAIQYLNRVYLNASCLKNMTEGQKRFLMAHELTHHQKNHMWKRIVVMIPLMIAKKAIEKNVEKNGNSPILQRYFFEGFGIPMILDLSLLGLLQAQLFQMHETEADDSAVLEAGAKIEDGIACLKQIHHPDTKGWPLYAKVFNVVHQMLTPVMCLPIIKQHMPHLVSLKDRASDLSSLKA